MLYVSALCLAASVGQSPEYTGPAYAEVSGSDRTVLARLTGAAMAGCVRAGMGPKTLARLFGPPELVERFNEGPVQWSYLSFGVSVYYPVRAFDWKPMTVERLIGDIGP